MEKDQDLGLYDDWDNTLIDGLEDEPFEVDVISTDENKPKIDTIQYGAFGEVMKPGSLVQKIDETHLPKDEGLINNPQEARVVKKLKVRTPYYTKLPNKEIDDRTK
jgi:hypothetical protein